MRQLTRRAATAIVGVGVLLGAVAAQPDGVGPANGADQPDQVAGTDGSELPYPAVHRVADGPAAPLPTGDAVAGRYELDTSVPIDNYRGVHLIDGQVVVVTRTDLRVYDPMTAALRWSYTETGRGLLGIAADRGVLMLVTYHRPSWPTEGFHYLGLDAETGAPLWSRTGTWHWPVGDTAPIDRLGYEGHMADVVDGVVPVIDGAAVADSRIEPEYVAGLDIRTGEEVWNRATTKVTEDCEQWSAPGAPGTAGDAEKSATEPEMPLVVERPCAGGGTALVAIEPRTGALMWRWPMPGGNIEPRTRAGYTLLAPAGGLPTLLGADGDEVFSGDAEHGCTVGCELLLGDAGPVVLIGRTSGLVAVSIGADGTVTDHSVPATGAAAGPAAGIAGSTLYLVSPPTAGLMPEWLTIHDLATGRSQLNPLLGRLDRSAFPPEGTSLLVVGGRVLVAGGYPSRVGWMSTYRRLGTADPSALGGAPVDAWPDACALLAGVSEGRERPAADLVDGRTRQPAFLADRFSDLGLPVLRCGRDVTVGGVDGTLWLTIEWTAADGRQAATMITAWTMPSTIGADEEFDVHLRRHTQRTPETDSDDSVAFAGVAPDRGLRVGPVIASLRFRSPVNLQDDPRADKAGAELLELMDDASRHVVNRLRAS